MTSIDAGAPRRITAAGTQPHSLARQGARTALGLAAGVGVACALAWRLGVHPRIGLEHVRGAPVGVIAGCVASAFAVLALQALRWHLVMAPVLGLKYGQAYRALVVGVMLNALLPARGGDLLRVQYLGRATGTSRATILGTEVVDRWLDWWGWLPIVLVLGVASDVPRWVFTAFAMFGAALVASGVVMVVAARRSRAARQTSLADSRASSRVASRMARAFRGFRTGVDAFASRRTMAIALGVAPLPWVWETGVLALAGRAFDVHLSLPQAFSVLVGFNAATVVPSPGAVGPVEAGGTAALAFLGVDHSRALAFMIVYHATQLVPAVVAGVAILVTERLPWGAGHPRLRP